MLLTHPFTSPYKHDRQMSKFYMVLITLKRLLLDGNSASYTKLNPAIELQFNSKQRRLRQRLCNYAMKPSFGEDDYVIEATRRNCISDKRDSPNFRGTYYRGVSKNSRSVNWQIIVMNEKGKLYVGTVDDIVKAAILSDLINV
jgi:hypothetical protein